MGRRANYIGIKDFFTLINALGGIGAIVLTVFGFPQYGVVSIFLGFTCGDSLDGYVARKTGTANKFGAKFDSASDQLSEGIAPAVVVAGYFAEKDKLLLGAFVSAFVALIAVVRVARFATVDFPEGSTYCGLPRVGAGILAAGLPFSFVGLHVMEPWTVAFLVIGFASLSLCPIPYARKEGRKIPGYALLIVVGFFIGCGILMLVNWSYLVDLLVIGFLVYALLGWVPVHVDDRKKFYRDYKAWSQNLSVK